MRDFRFTPSLSPLWLRLSALVTTMLFVWTLVLATPVQVLAQQVIKKAAAQSKPIVPLAGHDDPSWHTIDYHAAPKFTRSSGKPASIPPTLLDSVGQLALPVSSGKVAAWKYELYHKGNTKARRAMLHLWLGEYALAHDEQPGQAQLHFRQAQQTVPHNSPLYGLAAYDTAISLFYEGAYEPALTAFHSVITNKPGLSGFDRRKAALWLRHASACAGYHTERAKLGIPEPPRLDPLCGVAALAECLRASKRPFGKTLLLSHCRVTGEGSRLSDVVLAARNLKMAPHTVTADDEGLKALPKPLVAYVEHDHFVAVIKADKRGVSYLCSDCGAWPGGQVDLTWKQWHKLEATRYISVCVPGSDLDNALSQLPTVEKGLSSPSANIPIAGSSRRQYCQSLVQQATLIGLLKAHVVNVIDENPITCGFKNTTLPCGEFVCCPQDDGPFCSNTLSGAVKSALGASDGDPVNLATLEEEYRPDADMFVYNPTGPSVSWSRIYNSLSENDAQSYGQGWSHSYFFGIAPPVGMSLSGSLFLPNGARLPFTASVHPSSTNPNVVCSFGSGIPLSMVWNYDPGTMQQYFVVTSGDRSAWTSQQFLPGQVLPFTTTPLLYPVKLQDQTGHFINFYYTKIGNASSLLNAITDSSGQNLLTVHRDANLGLIQSVSDRFGRSVYYQFAGYAGTISFNMLTHVSQIAPTGAVNSPDRYAYDYQLITAYGPEGAKSAPFLHTITIPSPTGVGTAVATVNYDPATELVSSIIDANNNQHTYSIVDANHTKITISNPVTGVAYSYTVGFDMNMSATTATDGTNATLVLEATYADPNDPYRPSSVSDANGVAGGFPGRGIVSYTWDSFGHMKSMTSPYGITTNYNWTYTPFSLGELQSVQEGAKSPSTVTYYEPSGLPQTIMMPQPGTIGGTQPVALAFTYDTLGNVLTMKTPGNNATLVGGVDQGITATFNYGASPKIGQPLTVTNNLGKSVTYGYDSQGHVTSVADSLNNTSNFYYNIAEQPFQSYAPATNQTGGGRGYTQFNYLYPGGPVSSVALYDENATQIRTVSPIFGGEGELRSVSGSVLPCSYTYDAYYRPLTLKDGNNHATTYTYNSTGNLSQMAYADGKIVKATAWNPLGSPLTVVDARNNTINYLYNEPGSQCTSIQYPASSSLNAQATYDNYGRLQTMTDHEGSYSWVYDDLDELLTANTTYGTLPKKSLSYSYYPNGAPNSLVSPAGTSYYLYDKDGRSTSLNNPLNQVTNWTYLDNGWLWTQTAGNATTTYTYNALGQRTDMATRRNDASHTLLNDFGAISHDGAGNSTSITSNVLGAPAYGGLTNYQYDSRDQLTQEQSARSGSYTNVFNYDPAGNTTTFKGTGQTFNTVNQKNGLTYDGQGNPAVFSGKTLTWDAADRLTKVGTNPSFGYSGNQRVWKQPGTLASTRTYFLYDGTVPVCELDSSGNVVATNTFGQNGLLSRTSGGVSTFYSFDTQGNICQRLDSSGNVQSAHMTDAYGTQASTVATTDPFASFGGIWGSYNDSETGLALMGARYYDQNTGRFLNRDPSGYDGGINLYGYADNNPIMNVDPSGLGGNHVFDPFDDNAPDSSMLSDFSAGDHPGAVGAARFMDAAVHMVPGGMFIPAIAGVDMFGCRLSTCQRLQAAAEGITGLVAAGERAAGMGAMGATGSEPFMPMFGGGGGCFVAGTPISVGDATSLDNQKSSSNAKTQAQPAASRKALDPTQDTLHTKRIETVQAGDTVASRNPVTGKTEFKKVARTFQHTVYETVTLELADAQTGTVVQSLRGTPEHPFFTPGGRVAMGDLKPEMTVISRRGPPLVVKCVTREYYPAGIAVYNFEVEDDHAYFVGTAQGGAWVHNIGDCEVSDPLAEGPHTTISRDANGRVKRYGEWEPNPYDPGKYRPTKRFDRDGIGHHDKPTAREVPTPHIQFPTNPGGRLSRAREPEPWEYPK